MTVQREQLQALIVEIDGVLSKATPNLPWVMAGGATEQRQLLEKVRHQLTGLQQDATTNEDITPLAQQDHNRMAVQETTLPSQQQISQQILQAVKQEMYHLRAGLTQSIQVDVERLQRERAALQEDIKQLELRRQSSLQAQPSPVVTPELLRALLPQLQALLAQQGSAPSPLGGLGANPVFSGELMDGEANLGYGSQQLRQLQTFQAQLDQLLISLDSTLHLVGNSLQGNLQTYEESLSQGLAKMHTLGQQGELMFTAWMNLLVQRLGQESASYLQSSYPVAGRDATPPRPQRSLGSTTEMSGLTPQTRRILDRLGIQPPSTMQLPYPTADLSETGATLGTNNRFTLEDMDLDDLDLSDLDLDEDPLESLDTFDTAIDRDNYAPPRSPMRPAINGDATASALTKAQDGDINSALDFLEQLSVALQDQARSSQDTDLDHSIDIDLGDETDSVTDTNLLADGDVDLTLDDTLLRDLMDAASSSGSREDQLDGDNFQPPGALETSADQAGSEDENPELDSLYNTLFGVDGEADPSTELNPESSTEAPHQPLETQEPETVTALNSGVNPEIEALDPLLAEQTDDRDRQPSTSTFSAIAPTDASTDTVEALLLAAPFQPEDPTLSSESDGDALITVGEFSDDLPDDELITLDSDDLFPDTGEQVLGSSPLSEEETEIQPSDGSSPGVDPASSASNLLTLDDLFRSDEPEPPIVINPARPDVLDARGNPNPAFPFRNASLAPSLALEDSDNNSLASLEEFLGTEPLPSSPATTGYNQRDGSSQGAQPSPLTPSEADLGNTSADDGYIPAPPEETLLVNQGETETHYTTPETSVDFWLNANVLHQLSEDLSGLETDQVLDDSWDGLTFEDANFTGTDASPQIGGVPEPLDLASFQADLSPTPPAPDTSPPLDQSTTLQLDALFGEWTDSSPPAEQPDPDSPPNTDGMEGGLSAPIPLPDGPPIVSDRSSEGDLDDMPPASLEDMFADVPFAVSEGRSPSFTLSSSPPAHRDATIDIFPLPSSAPKVPDTSSSNNLDIFGEFSEIEDPEAPEKKKTRLTPSPSSSPVVLPVVVPDNPSADRSSGDRSASGHGVSLPFSNPTPTSGTAEVTAIQPPELSGHGDRHDRGTWHLGIDIGDTGLSAVLFHQETELLYPLGWTSTQTNNSAPSSRLPIVGYVPSGGARGPDASAELHPLGCPADAMEALLQSAQGGQPLGTVAHHIKSSLKIGIPYTTRDGQVQPLLQSSAHTTIALADLRDVLITLLASLGKQSVSRSWQLSALGLEPDTLQQALHSLSSVLLGYPHNWSDTYCINLREAILQAGLVNHADQIVFIEDTIAATLSGLPTTQLALRRLSGRGQRTQPGGNWRGSTLVISSGATTTELSVVFLPDQVQELAHDDFSMRSFAYAGSAIDQDIICQLFYPLWIDQQQQTVAQAQAQSYLHDKTADFIIPKPEIPWAALGITDTTIPMPGEPDFPVRQALQQRLEQSIIGTFLLEAAQYIKVALQSQESVVIEVGGQLWPIDRHQLESQVFLPFIQRLNREITTLLSHTGFFPQTINQVLCTGGTASLPAIARWLQKKLPNATIIQDTYLPDEIAPTALPQTMAHITPQSSTCSRIAYGLSVLPLYPNVINLPRHHYSDYFLLSALLELVADLDASTSPSEPLTLALDDILQHLDQQGVNPHACYRRILALLEGHLPPGLVPLTSYSQQLATPSVNNPDYHQLLAAPLFEKQPNATHEPRYRPNPIQCRIVRDFLATVFQPSLQPLNRVLASPISALSGVS